MATRQPRTTSTKRKSTKRSAPGAQKLALPAGVSVADLGTTLTLQESAERLGVSAKTVRRMIARGELPHAHLVPMTTGKGEQWAVPVSDLEQHQAKTRKVSRPDPVAGELEQLRRRVAELEQRANLYEALATERSRELEQLHGTMRLMLTTGNSRRRWWRKAGADI